MVSSAIIVDSHGELASLDALLYEDIISLDERLGVCELFPSRHLACRDRAASVVRLHDHRIADKWGYETLDALSTHDEKRLRYFHAELLDEKIGTIFIHTSCMHGEVRVGIWTAKCREKCCDLSIFPIHPMEYWDDKIV